MNYRVSRHDLCQQFKKAQILPWGVELDDDEVMLVDGFGKVRVV